MLVLGLVSFAELSYSNSQNCPIGIWWRELVGNPLDLTITIHLGYTFTLPFFHSSHFFQEISIFMYIFLVWSIARKKELNWIWRPGFSLSFTIPLMQDVLGPLWDFVSLSETWQHNAIQYRFKDQKATSFCRLKEHCWEFPGSPVVRTWSFHCRDPDATPGQGTKIPQALWHSQKKKGAL